MFDIYNHTYTSVPSSMNAKTVLMTPEKAKSILANNGGNRPLRKGWVTELCQIIKNDEWELTHQAIAIAENGRLLDGQHRLQAIALSNKAVPILVVENCKEGTFAFIDKGVKRSISDSISKDKKYMEGVSYVMRLSGCRSDRPAMAMLFYDAGFGAASEKIINYCSTNRRIASASPVKAAAIIAFLECDRKQELLNNYKNFVTLNYNSMTPSLQAFEKQIASNKIVGADHRSLFVRAYKSFMAFNKPVKMLKLGEIEVTDTIDRVQLSIMDIINRFRKSW